MLVILSVLAVVAFGLMLGLAMLFRLVLVRSAAQQGELAELRHEMTRLFGEAEEGELTRMLRDLHAGHRRSDEERAARRRADERYTQLSDESRWERDWKRSFEKDR